MPEDVYKEGYLEFYSGELGDQDFLEDPIWSDGYLSFSMDEKRFVRETDAPQFLQILSGQQKTLAGHEGLLMEIHLWGDLNGTYEEITIEREPDNTFYFQKYVLSTKPPNKPNCYYREASGKSISKHFSEALNMWEIMMWEHRLNVFIIRGRKSS